MNGRLSRYSLIIVGIAAFSLFAQTGRKPVFVSPEQLNVGEKFKPDTLPMTALLSEDDYAHNRLV